MALLQSIHGANPGQLYSLDGESSILGRHPECDIVLDAAAVSRQHARILKFEGNFYVEDLNSRNGTFVNGRQVIQRQQLNEGDEVQICDLSFVFHEGPAPSPGKGALATMILDDEDASDSSTVMSKLDVSGGTSGLQLQVNAEAKLKALVEISQNLGKAVGLNQVLSKVLDSLFAIFLQADRGFVVLKDPDSGKLIPKAVKQRRQQDRSAIRISRTIVNRVMQSKEVILSADAAADSRFDMAESVIDFHIRSMMCAPLIGSDGNALGVLQIDTLDQRSRFSRDDLDVLASVAYQTAFAVENAQLHEAAIREQAIERDLLLANQVQQRFLPISSPELPGYDFFEFYEPANKLGGDYYDYIPLADGRLAIVVADVSGKGIAASLLMARLSAEARYCLASVPRPADAVARLNDMFCHSTWDDRFVTFVVALLDPGRHELTIVNAGHLPPLLRRCHAEVVPLAEDEAGLPLGVSESCEYPQLTVNINPGDSLILYTDGITEAMNDKNELYGRQRLHTSVADEQGDVQALGQRILADVKQFVGRRAQSDDMCLTCFGRAPAVDLRATAKR